MRNTWLIWNLACLVFACAACSRRDTAKATNQTKPTHLSILASTPASTATLTPALIVAAPQALVAVQAGSDGNLLEKQLLDEGYQLKDSKMITLNDTTCQATLYRHPHFSSSDRLLVYKKQDEQSVVLYDLHSDLGRITAGGMRHFGERITISFGGRAYLQQGATTDWYDMNGDDLPELGIFISNGGIKCIPCNQFQVIQLHPDKGIINLTLSVPTEDKLDFFAVTNIIDVNDDGVMEWQVYDDRYKWLDYDAPSAYRIYAWDGETYRNASHQFPDHYQAQINEIAAQLEKSGFVKYSIEATSGQVHIGKLITLLLAYDNIGQREEGWKIFEAYANPAKYERNSPVWLELWDQFQAEYGTGN